MAKLELLRAEVYCGTYGKYNRGSLDGGWLTLADYHTNEEFLEACKKLHEDERDPEFMFQDVEYLPDGFYSESCIYPEVFEVLNVVRKWNEDKQEAFQAFCDDKGWEPDMFSIDEFSASYKPQKRVAQKPIDKDAAELIELVKNDPLFSVIKPYRAIKVRDGMFISFNKPEIEKQFCFGWSSYGGTSEEEANEMCANFGEKEFRESNIDRLKREYERKSKIIDRYKQVSIAPKYYGETPIYYIVNPFNPPSEGEVRLTEEETSKLRERFHDVTDDIISDFDKRINSYLKRYGLSKIRKWTYWADE